MFMLIQFTHWRQRPRQHSDQMKGGDMPALYVTTLLLACLGRSAYKMLWWDSSLEIMVFVIGINEGFHLLSVVNFFRKGLFIYLFWEGKGGRKRGRGTSMCGCLLRTPTGNLVCNPGMCPETLWFTACAQSTEPHQPGQLCVFKQVS